MNEAIRMQLSAFVDGELPENEAELLLRRLSQDAELRQQVSEYLAIGRVMRGEPQVTGIDTLRDRVAASLDDVDYVAEDDGDVPTTSGGFARPAAGFAVAATVAIVALFGIRQYTATEVPADPDAGEAVAITQPEPDALLDQYRQSHGDITEAEAGAAAIADRLRRVDVPQPGGGVEFVEIPASDVADDDAADDEEDPEADAAVDTAAE
jgi:hypothetical protein